MGTPQYIGSNSAGVNATNANVTCNYPGASASGDLLVMAVMYRRLTATAYTVATPSGWTLLDTQNSSAATGDYGAIYYRFRGAETSVTLTASNATTMYGNAIIHGYRGDIDPTTPIDTYATSYSNTSSTAKTTPTVTTTVDGDAIANFIFSERSASTNYTWPTPISNEQEDSYAGTTGQITRTSYVEIKPRAGATGTTAATASAASTGTFSAKVAVKSGGASPLFLANSTANNTFSASTTCNYPAGSASGDFLVMYVYRTVSSLGLTSPAPAGWTLIDSQDMGATNATHDAAYWRFRGAETSVTTTSSGATVSGAMVHIDAFDGASVDPTTPIYAYTKTNTGNVSGNDLTPNSVATSLNSVALSISGAKSFSTGTTSNATNYWKILDEVNTSSGCSIFDAVVFKPTNPTGIMSRTLTVASSARSMWFFTIQPAQSATVNADDDITFTEDAYVQASVSDTDSVTLTESDATLQITADPDQITLSETAYVQATAPADDTITLSETAYVEADVFADDSITFSEDAYVSNSIQTTEDITLTEADSTLIISDNDAVTWSETAFIEAETYATEDISVSETAWVTITVDSDGITVTDDAKVGVSADDSITVTETAGIAVHVFATDDITVTEDAGLSVYADDDVTVTENAIRLISGLLQFPRQVKIPADNRRVIIDREPRRVSIDPDYRRTSIRAEVRRHIVIPKDQRVFEIEGE